MLTKNDSLSGSTLLPLCRRHVHLYSWLRMPSPQIIRFTTCSAISWLERFPLQMTTSRKYLHGRRTLDKNAWYRTVRCSSDLMNTTRCHVHVCRRVVECWGVPSYNTFWTRRILLIHDIRTMRCSRWYDGIHCLWIVRTGHTLNTITQENTWLSICINTILSLLAIITISPKIYTNNVAYSSTNS